MPRRGEALELATALEVGDETTLGLTDSALCAEALRYYAANVNRKKPRPVMLISVILVLLAFGMVAHAAKLADVNGDGVVDIEDARHMIGGATAY